jgi:hypothetical protein
MIRHHLTEVELVDFVEGRLTPARAEHVEACAECSTRAVGIRTVVERTAGAPVPEPSPLFWEHLSARVSDAIGPEPFPRPDDRGRFMRAPAWAWAATAACATIIAGAALWRGVQSEHRRDAVSGPDAAEIVLPLPDGDPDAWIGTDGAWALVQALAEDAGWEETGAAGIVARPQATDHVIPQLSGEERSELARLIQEELHRNGA